MIEINYGELDLSTLFLRSSTYTNSLTVMDKVFSPRLLKISYPFITNHNDIELQNRLNKALDSFLWNFIIEQISLYEEDSNVSSITATYKIFMNQNNVISILYNLYTHLHESSSNITVLKSITLNTSTVTVYYLKDLFKQNSSYQNILSNIIKKQIKSRNISLIKEYDGVKDTTQFYLTPSSIVIYYGVYEYTAYAGSPLIFEIPYKEISNILIPNFSAKVYSSYGISSQNTSQKDDINVMKTALNLFKNALEEFAAYSPEEAALLWAKGVKTRNGALQYSVLNNSLKYKMKKCLKHTNWITGSSSPWVDTYDIIETKKIDSITYKVIINFHLVSHNYDAGYVSANLTVEKKGNHWLIANIK
ncbi:DUF3298 and DUF4163 domain-containing protein [Clostridium sp. DJ247]|uniref:DUF3298 and DUF4163 domain-containing protein n=1 Tax=Clostridium sp. DJ247 TaxID=2726188 RepID=UPI00162A02DE|nr:DUF3298 and DUF4163 domain-containing protein [Clostridium sp. DJ247]MBC2581872.1 DUF3298 and DUF4163 domain-containing protein [Clostridium sp. DJ247]